MSFSLDKIEAMIYTIRGHKVMLDRDLAKLYEVETGALNRQVRRNISRFPDDFMIDPNSSELEDLRCQFGIAKPSTVWNHKRRSPPMLFTENGVAMLSTVLNSERAIQVNIAIMRTFTKFRSFLSMDNSLEGRVGNFEKGTHKLFKIVFERLDTLEEQITPKLPANRKRIGLKQDQKN
ncbi:MAG TPA: ORF6N domain-containing protein [Bacteriovoracaceae bacterium]|nr:ORF6N domain-containing protein [Bacteriovoracaceae bacterium]